MILQGSVHIEEQETHKNYGKNSKLINLKIDLNFSQPNDLLLQIKLSTIQLILVSHLKISIF
jgi:hypothetical protein